MFKTIMTIFLTVITVVFSLQNSDHVPIYFISGRPTQIRLIFLLLIAGTAGYFIRYITTLNGHERLKREIRMLRSKLHREKEVDHFEEDGIQQ